MPSRYIHSRLSSRQVPNLLQAIFVAELLTPSKCIWLVSPWISDIQVIDNTSNSFMCLEPSWSRSRILLSQILTTLTQRGTIVHVATRPDKHNRSFIEALLIKTDGVNCQVHSTEELHSKGILGDGYYLAGSMNFTYNGITVNEEALTYDTSPQVIAEQQLIFGSRWGVV